MMQLLKVSRSSSVKCKVFQMLPLYSTSILFSVDTGKNIQRVFLSIFICKHHFLYEQNENLKRFEFTHIIIRKQIHFCVIQMSACSSELGKVNRLSINPLIIGRQFPSNQILAQTGVAYPIVHKLFHTSKISCFFITYQLCLICENFSMDDLKILLQT